MRPTPLRKFTLVDAMVLIGATAAALFCVRDIDARTSFDIDSTPFSEWSVQLMLSHAVSLGADLNTLLAPVMVSWSAALWLLRMKKPRPRAWRVYRQPGMAA